MPALQSGRITILILPFTLFASIAFFASAYRYGKSFSSVYSEKSNLTFDSNSLKSIHIMPQRGTRIVEEDVFTPAAPARNAVATYNMKINTS